MNVGGHVAGPWRQERRRRKRQIRALTSTRVVQTGVTYKHVIFEPPGTPGHRSSPSATRDAPARWTKRAARPGSQHMQLTRLITDTAPVRGGTTPSNTRS